MTPRVVEATVLVCTRGRPGAAAEAVASVLAGEARPAEVLVVDQSDDVDRTVEALPVPAGTTVRVLRPGTTGLSRARNLGFAEATQPVVAMLDDDMLAEPGWLGALLDARQRADEITTGRVLRAPLRPGEHPLPPAALVESDVAVEHRGRQPGDVVPGGGVALPRQLVLDLGGYDERLGPGARFPAAEDNDLGLRALDAGAIVRHVPGAVSRHRGRSSRGAVLRQRWHYGRGKGAFYAKHPGRYARDRVRAELRVRLGRIARPWRSPATAVGDVVHLAGMASGAIGWRRHHRRP